MLCNVATVSVFEAYGCTTSSIEDQISLGKSIIDMYAKGQWNKDWAVITELVRAESGTILISAARNAKLELSVSASLASAGFNLADASLGLGIEFMSNMHTKTIAEPKQSLTPLFKARRLKSTKPLNSIFAARHILAMDIEAPATGKGDLYFGDISFDMSQAEVGVQVE